MKQILSTKVNDKQVFIVGNICAGVVKAEQQLDIKIEPTGLINDAFGLSYARSHGLVYSLQGFKQWQGIK